MEETDVLDRLVPGCRVTLRDERGVLHVVAVRETHIVAYSDNGGFRTPALSRIVTVLPMETK